MNREAAIFLSVILWVTPGSLSVSQASCSLPWRSVCVSFSLSLSPYLSLFQFWNEGAGAELSSSRLWATTNAHTHTHTNIYKHTYTRVHVPGWSCRGSCKCILLNILAAKRLARIHSVYTHTNTPTHVVATLVDTAYAAPLATLARIRHNLLVMRSTAKKL